MGESKFIKLLQSDQARALAADSPNAFFVLTIIALRSNADGIAFIGQRDFEGKGKREGLSRQQVRTALTKLESTHISTIKSTHSGTTVKLLDSGVYKTFQKKSTHQSTHQSTSDQPINKINISSAIATDISFNIMRGAKHIYQNFFSPDLTEELKERGTFELSEEMCLKIFNEAKNIFADEKQAQELMMSQIYRFSTFLVDKPKIAKSRTPHLTILNWIRSWEKTEKKPFKYEKKGFPVDWKANQKRADELMRSLHHEIVKRKIKGGVGTHGIDIECDGSKLSLKYTEHGFMEQLESYLRKQQII